MGDIIGNIDLTYVVLQVFILFFVGLVLYLHRENKREGYPLESDRSGSIVVQGFPAAPAPKFFALANGHSASNPNYRGDRRDAPVEPSELFPGAPFVPTGNPMLDGVGPASYANREDEPELGLDGRPVIFPLSSDPESRIDDGDPDVRGWEVLGADNEVAGKVVELWIDRAEPQVRYLEVDAGGRRVLLPIYFAWVNKRRQVIEVSAILASQFANAPVRRNPDIVTKLEEDKSSAYFAGGLLYATPARAEPLL